MASAPVEPIAPVPEASIVQAADPALGATQFAPDAVPAPLIDTPVPPVDAQPVVAEPVVADPVLADPADSNTITVTGRVPIKADPLEAVNEVAFDAVQSVDRAIIGPVAKGYKKGVPGPLRQGVHNFLNNLDEPIVFLNFLLQLKPGKAVETLGRFTLNSTIGIGGVIDVAKKKPFNLPRRSNGLADTLGYYGVKPGPYLFLPLIGSTTVRDMFGRIVDISILPAAVGQPLTDPVFSMAQRTLGALDERTEMDDQIHRLRDSGGDSYAAMRAFYLQKREAEIDVLKGRRECAECPLIGAAVVVPAVEKTVVVPVIPQSEAGFPLEPVVPLPIRNPVHVVPEPAIPAP